MEDIKTLPFSGVMCDKSKNVCKVWWLKSKVSKTETIQLSIPASSVPGHTEQNKEIFLEDMLNSSLIIK